MKRAATATLLLVQLVAAVPLGRLGTADEVATVVAWLLSSEASYVTGGVYLGDAGVMS